MAKHNSINVGVLILVVALAVGVLAVVSTGAAAAKGSGTVTCSDSDGGQKQFMKGTCTGKDAYGGRPAQTGSWTDSCDSPSALTEWYCDKTGKYCNKMSIFVTGPITCVDGALVQTCTPTNGGVEICGNGIDEDCSGADLICSTTGCTDSDGSNTRIKGSCTDSSGTYTDYCESSTQAMDYVCSNQNTCIRWGQVADIGYACVDGALVAV
jgi:hypothetical protein